ncbi:hypothetical protein TSTA_030760 [Talaromyces stipitatus ATCC 10500]|uniref:Uncharacterized protein n=1 Tax=Talaromyces stipitatus (strain ATCC 10500 / CBS 375.48 / QM 6759 / NRRL 1006) TaxID=441959 RepID=B8M7T4_TALSN|nr:uncharacterized protein TSTA_030760 [Talaromyces stipitatus ATCC 10500]EED19813.1 hypothetical protein TSTA_030760 [Talaromyces stipitatus ATCC 10500]
MLSKTVITALLVTAAVALPANTAPRSLTESDSNTMAKSYVPEAGADGQGDATPEKGFYPYHHHPPGAADSEADALEKRFYIYHHHPPGAADGEQAADLDKRDPNTLVKFYIPETSAGKE